MYFLTNLDKEVSLKSVSLAGLVPPGGSGGESVSVPFVLFCFVLAVPGLSCGTRDLHCHVRDL